MALGLGAWRSAAAAPAEPFYEGRVELRRGDVALASLRVEIADQPDERTRGLMGRNELPDDRGMLFVFDRDGDWSFWMRGTPLPLAIAFVRADGRIVDIQDMAPNDESLHSPPESILMALEVPQGYFDRRGVAVGDVLVLRRLRLRLPLVLRYDSANP